MRIERLLIQNLVYFWRTNLAVVAGVGTAVAVLAGALLVGESVRSSLRGLVLQRLGNTDYVVSADRFFREELAASIAAHKEFRGSFGGVCPIILARGVIIHEGTGLRAHNVNVYAVDDRFWKLQGKEVIGVPTGRDALLGEALARDIGARIEDTILLRLEKHESIPQESLYGRRDDIGRTVRLTCKEILPARTLGEFSLQPGQGPVLSVFVPLRRLQSDLQQPGRANTLLLSALDQDDHSSRLRRILRGSCALEDLGLRLRPLAQNKGIAVESSRILLEESLAQTAAEVASASKLRAGAVYTYLANSIRSGDKSIPYSVVTAADLFPEDRFRLLSGDMPLASRNEGGDPIWLNEWAQRDLGAAVGDEVDIDYYVWLEEGRLIQRSARFRVAGVFALEGDAADPSFAPEVPGITDAAGVGDWDPPFPLDLNRIRPRDEDYWDRYRTAPKAFILLQKGQDLWRTRFGMLTSLRLLLPPGSDFERSAKTVAVELRSRLDPEKSGFAVRFAKGAGIEASRGSTNFGEYFLYFSFFLIAAAVLLAALFFRLGLEQRVREIGVLRSVGFPSATVRALFTQEALLLSGAGCVAGLFGSIAYAGLLLLGLRTWWSPAAGPPHLQLHLAGLPLLAGALAGVFVAVSSVALTLRGLKRSTARALLAGVFDPPSERTRRVWMLRAVTSATLAAGMALLAFSHLGKLSNVLGFFGAGSSLLVALLCVIALRFRREKTGLLYGKGWPAIIRLGARNTGYRPGRSLLCVALIASATFVIASLEAFRHDLAQVSMDKHSGTGGFPVYAESVLPILHDLNSLAGQEALNLSPREVAGLKAAHFVPFRLRPGDDASCLNLYAPQEPRILGARAEFLRSARFSFRESMAENPEETWNPWLLLERDLGNGAIPAIGDANTIQYILRRRLGEEVVLRNSRGEALRLRLVAALRDSIFQGELLISETHFLRAFAGQQGYRFFLVDVSPERLEEVIRVLEEGLGDFGLDASLTRERLAAYHRVENTYLSTFQSLGALGLVLGTIGLGAILLRNVLERRHELALLRAVGYRKADLAGLVVAENGVLLLLGLLAGTASALLATAPVLISRAGPLPAAMLALTLGGVLVTGLGSSLLAVVAVFRSPLLPALRCE